MKSFNQIFDGSIYFFMLPEIAIIDSSLTEMAHGEQVRPGVVRWDFEGERDIGRVLGWWCMTRQIWARMIYCICTALHHS